jgi:hypothetical protein
MTTPRVHCTSRLPTAHDSFGADGYDDPSGVGEPLRGGTGRHGGHLPGGEPEGERGVDRQEAATRDAMRSAEA